MVRKGRNVAEIQLPLDLRTALQNKRIPAVLATFSEVGHPHASLINLIYPIGTSSVIIAIDKRHKSYENLVWQKKIMLYFMEKGLSYGILGRAGVMRAPCNTHPEVNIIRVDVVEVHRDCHDLLSIDNAIKIKYKDQACEEVDMCLMEEIKELAGYL